MAVELDDLDRRIVALLLADARVSDSEVADKVGLSRPAVAERIKKLERQGVIRGFTTVLDAPLLGRTITAFVAARGPRLDAKAWKRFREVMALDDVLELHTVAGEDCFFIKVRTDSIESLHRIVGQLTAPPLSLATRTTIVMQTHLEKIGGIALGEEEPRS